MAPGVIADRDPEKYTLPTDEGSTQIAAARIGDVQLSDEEWQKCLSPNQFKVLRQKSTEPGHRIKFPDGFDDHFETGVYFCAACAAAGQEVPLYTSKMKFDCGCGWPGFWTNVQGAVYEERDADGRRCEILCAHCDGHLGHVFRGEPFGNCTGERHCVNSLSLVFASASSGGLPNAAAKLWEIVGGVGKGGVLVRKELELGSTPEAARLSTGALVEELDLEGERLHYRLLQGQGPKEGWISVRLTGKELAVTTEKRPLSQRFIVPQYTGPVSAPRPAQGSGSALSLPPQLKAIIQQLKAAGVAIDETNPEQVRKVLRMVKEAQKEKKAGLAGLKEQLVEKEHALPGRTEALQLSDKHYVLGTPMRGPWPNGFQIMIFANGCFWGSEKGIWRLPGGGIHSTAVGYAGGHTPNPTYEEACSGRTGHTEAVQVVFDPSRISIVDILRWFWEAHDPTQGMGQGNDRGTQYRSALYYFDDEQRQLFEASKSAYEAALKSKGRGRGDITTEIRAAADFKDTEVFYYAEDYHQQYLAKPGARPYCSAQPQEVALPPFDDWVPRSLLGGGHAPRLPEAFWRAHSPRPGCVIGAPSEPIKWEAPKI